MFRRHLGPFYAPHDTASMGGGDVNTRGRAPVADAMSRGHRAAAETTDTDTDTGDDETGDDDDAAADDAPETTDRDDSADKPSLQQAFERSLRQHSKPAPKGARTEQAADADASTADEGAERGTRRGTASTRAAATTDQDGLITDAEYDALQEKHKDDPKALRKALEGAFTQKTQKLAEERTSLERLKPYSELIDALESDDAAARAEAVRFLAKEYGVDLAPAKGATTEERAEQAEDATAALLEQFRADLGPELEYLADGLMPAVSKMVERLTASTVSKELAPVKAREKVLTEKEAVRENDALFEDFTKAVPDWKDHEDAMFALSQKMTPGKDMTPLEYLKALHRLVTSDATEAEIERRAEAKATAKLAKKNQKTNRAAAAVDERVDDVADRHVSKRGPDRPSLQEAWDAAKRGERFED